MIIKEIPTTIKTGTYNHPWIGIVGVLFESTVLSEEL
jgi:hypothetical protein